MLKEWLITHVQGTDLKYAPFLKAKGVSWFPNIFFEKKMTGQCGMLYELFLIPVGMGLLLFLGLPRLQQSQYISGVVFTGGGLGIAGWVIWHVWNGELDGAWAVNLLCLGILLGCCGTVLDGPRAWLAWICVAPAVLLLLGWIWRAIASRREKRAEQ
jgi:hypothetical protein